MVEFKLCISDPKSGKSYPREVKDDSAKPFVGLRIGQVIKGESIDLTGYEFEVTGGSDKCGFPLRSGIKGKRQRILTYGGVGVKPKGDGVKVRKTVCGSSIHEDVSQINLKIIKEGKAPLGEPEAPAEAGEGEAAADASKEAPKDDASKADAPAADAVEEKTEEKVEEAPAEKEAPAEEKDKPEEKKEAAEEKPAEEAPSEEKPADAEEKADKE